jgi:hypothetical protein
MAKISLNSAKGKIKNKLLEPWDCDNASIEQWGQSRKEVNRSTKTKKEAVPTSCRFEKPAANPKDYFCWLTQFLVVQCSISCVRDERRTTQIDSMEGKKLSQFSKWKIKNKL